MGEFKRIALWSLFVVQLLITSTYMILCWATADNLYKSYNKLPKDEISLHIWKAPAAASVLGGLMVLTFNMLSCVILIRGSISQTGPGFGYGFIVAYCFVMSFFTLLCGLVLDGFKETVVNKLATAKDTDWSAMDTGAFTGTYVFGYICCALFMVFFFVLVIFQGAVTKQLGVYEQMMANRRLMEMDQMHNGHLPMNPLASMPAPRA